MNKKLTFIDKVILLPLWLITLAPLRLLYLFSDLIYLVLFYVIGYRKKVVYSNLRKAFPEKSKKEINQISHKFFHYLCDYFIESIYMLQMSEKEFNRRFIYKNPELLNQLSLQGRSVIIAPCHYGNWEWAINLSMHIDYMLYGVYKPLTNKLFDKLFIYMRSRFLPKPVPMKKTLRLISDELKQNRQFALYMMSDQRPSPEDINYWTLFLNQDTPVLTGIDRIAQKYNLCVVFQEVERVKRGYYEVTHRLVTNAPQTEQANFIAEKYMRMVEGVVLKKPEFYLWSHKRWKYSAEAYKPKLVK